MVNTSATTPLSKNPAADLMLELPPSNKIDPVPLNATASSKTTCAEELFDPTCIVPLFDNVFKTVRIFVPGISTAPRFVTLSKVARLIDTLLPSAALTIPPVTTESFIKISSPTARVAKVPLLTKSTEEISNWPPVALTVPLLPKTPPPDPLRRPLFVNVCTLPA